MPNTDSPTFPLANARQGVSLMVGEVAVEGPDATRLQAMGICPGRRIEIAKEGDPLIVRVLGTRVGLAGCLAAQVFVCLANSPVQSPESASSLVA